MAGTNRQAEHGWHQSYVVALRSEGLQCFWGHSGGMRWELNLRRPTDALLRGGALAWPWDNALSRIHTRGLGVFNDRPMLVSQSSTSGQAVRNEQSLHLASVLEQLPLDDDHAKPSSQRRQAR